MPTPDVIVIGGGVIGCAVARELARGGVRVVLVERAAVGAGASSGAAGMVAAQAESDGPGPLFDLGVASRRLYPEFLAALRDETGIDCEYATEGILYSVLTAEDEAVLERRLRWQQAAGLRVERLTGEAARRLAPDLPGELRWALHYPDDHWLDNRRLATALGAAAAAAGVELRTGQPALRILAERGRVTGVECADGRRTAPTVINAAGCWAAQVGLPAGVAPPPVRPVRGQIVTLETRPPRVRHALYSPRAYLVPRRDGRLLAGSTYEEAGYEARVTAAGLARILAAAAALAPGLRECPVGETWAGLRPRTPDQLPILGRAADLEGLVYATGHYRHGILLAPITARLVAALVLGRAPETDLGPFRPDRFARPGAPAADVVAFTPDLFFATRIEETARAAGTALEVVRDGAALAARTAAARPRLVIVDVGAGDAAIAAIAAVRRLPGAPPVVAYVSHVDAAATARARAAGCDRVLARSAFTRELPALLREAACRLSGPVVPS